jgi:hypothetical protein
VPAIILGITLSKSDRHRVERDWVGIVPAVQWLVQVFWGDTQAYDVILHPTAFAGWIDSW